MTLVIHTHVTEPEVTAAIRSHHLNLALILQTIRFPHVICRIELHEQKRDIHYGETPQT